MGCRTGPPGYLLPAGRGTTTLCRSQLYPPFRDYEFGYSFITLFFAVQAATTEWLGDMPNPLEIGGQIEGCLLLAQEAGLREDALGNSLQKQELKL